MTVSADAAKSRKPRKRMHYGEGREALLKAAVRVVARGGLRSLTYRAVAEEAGVAHSLVVHHFGSRAALIEEALAHTVQTSMSHSILEPGFGEGAHDSRGLSEMVSADPDARVFKYELLLESRRRPELQPQVRAMYDEYFAVAQRELSHMLGADVDKALARLVFAALEGLVMHQLVLGEPEATDAALESLRSLLRHFDAVSDKAGE
ncbi:TetR/AcrR family transcriptional regulator [Streptomyces sp. NBC_00576]|uniref:TetR/AcrR family transcriptional regulator n=1 Tax=Streptomyces sp. NBC_00576 TaxID=2903665 RepID=UPI002E7FC0C7|nr:TetR family transcriptional regulator [Streptomyces sp. NBC_00576]WUB69331.1 TetR family transcriptional regulator [Streptomyces sp. NBC_00576]